MNTMNPWIGIVGWALIHFLWQGCLLWLGVALSLRCLRQAKPSARYAVACAGLLLCVALPISGIFRNPPSVISSAAPEAVSEWPAFEVIQGEGSPSQPIETSLERVLDSQLGLIVMVWGFGAGLLSLRFASGLAWVRNLKQSAALPDEEAWMRRLDDLSRALGLERSVILRVAQGIESPVAAGLWRPVIFIPMSILTGMPPELVEALLAHELAHIKRHDYLVNLIQSAIEVVLFYHPAVWWISNRIRIEREQICDDLAVRALGEPRRLALALQELDLLQLTIPHLAQAAHGGNLMSRIRRLIHPEPRPLAWKALVSILGITAACVATAAISSSRLQETPPPPPPPQAPPPPPRPPKPPKPPRLSGSEMTYAFVRQGKMTSCSNSSRFSDEVNALKKNHSTDFFCFREKGTTYVIDDPAEVAKAQALFQPMDELGKQMDELGKEMNVHGAKMDALGKDMNAASKHGDPHSKEMNALGKQMGVLGKEMGALHRRRGELERRHDREKLSSSSEKALEQQLNELDKQLQVLDTQMGTLSKSMEAHGRKMEEAHKPMEAIGQKMSEAGKPMEEVGTRMEAVGALMEKEGQKIDEGLKKFTQEALASGKAKPATR